MTVASVVVPTTGDRGPVLAHSVGSVLRQTVEDLEVLIIGDGVEPTTADAIEALRATDDRVRFFDFPEHERRGEPNRHEVLTEEATGDIVCYLCDRDLWFPDHVAEMARVLASADFGHTLRFAMLEDDVPDLSTTNDLTHPDDRDRVHEFRRLVPLSAAGHTMSAYRRLPHGWRTTPEGYGTDHYMWLQFLDQPDVTVGSSSLPTVLTFKRGHHPGWSTAARLEILERWSPRLTDRDAMDRFRADIFDGILADRSHLVRENLRRKNWWPNRLARRLLPRSLDDRLRFWTRTGRAHRSD